MLKNVKLKLLSVSIFFLFLPFVVGAVSLGDIQTFNIERSYDFYKRTEIQAILQKSTNQLYFYIEESWWNNLSQEEQLFLDQKIYNLSVEFERKIYPELTSVFGSEAEFGVDNNKKITVLIHRMSSEVGGYFSSGDIYEKIQYPKSNQRKIIYLNSRHIDNSNVESFLAHEFMHLITVNQKNIKRNVNEQVWFNELRSEYVPTLLGYNNNYKGSYLENRVGAFLSKPSVSLTEWKNRREDYGAINLFAHYLVDHYGIEILVDSLKSNKIGIESINYALLKNGFKEDFSQIFKDWLITVLVNDCNLGKKYCYLNKSLKDFKINPSFYYLQKSRTVLSVNHNTSYWTGNWHRFIDGREIISLEFSGSPMIEFEIPYIVCDFQNKCFIDYFDLDENQNGKLIISKFNTRYSSLTIIPFIKSQNLDFEDQPDFYSFSWEASTYDKEDQKIEENNPDQILAKIAELKRQIAEYKAQLNILLGVQEEQILCSSFNNNLYFGMTNNSEVRCLQEFLKNQGSDIYPEALVTGNFLSLTQQAVIRFQEKYAQEILVPLNLKQGTGFVGPRTILKINNLIN